MEVVDTVDDIRQIVADARLDRKLISLVPTMGALHKGHLSLVDIASDKSDLVIMSIFVNPLQFNVKEDLDNYPRSIEDDKAKAIDSGVDILFTPGVEEIYDLSETGRQVMLVAGDKSDGLCGATRPGHFDGVVTVINKLFNIITPDVAIFGEKDYQQLKVIEQMVEDLHLPVQILSGPLIRDERGLALSSRNLRLTPEEYEKAIEFPWAMQTARKLLAEGIDESDVIIAKIKEILEKNSILVDYMEIRDQETLQPLNQITDSAQLLGAVFIGSIRLIDNIPLRKRGVSLNNG